VSAEVRWTSEVTYYDGLTLTELKAAGFKQNLIPQAGPGGWSTLTPPKLPVSSSNSLFREASIQYDKAKNPDTTGQIVMGGLAYGLKRESLELKPP
jgi:hypothetical protein